ncbi:hypothetical protein PR048_018094 [Dryococelus australis]|uniref:DDE-1 domain-containing protein n=1 Tax=Dryococelus australis TaxID=614101 RepID=A0ABQ9HBA9_9NEOP|nr:hypothetical protein PR048_018094 [Dryococelus australis]
MDNHNSHCTLDAVLYARGNSMVLVTSPPHCTHKLQPLDVGLMGPFKANLKKNISFQKPGIWPFSRLAFSDDFVSASVNDRPEPQQNITITDIGTTDSSLTTITQKIQKIQTGLLLLL